MTRKDAAAAVALAIVLAAGCGKSDNSADTDKAGEQLKAAQTTLVAKREAVVNDVTELERQKRELALAQQALADREASLRAETAQLGSAHGTLATAQATYRTAVQERLAKLDAGLASLATRNDVAAQDAATGLAARRKALGDRVATMPTDGAAWTTYTTDVDTTFDGIERDLRAALK